MTWITGQILNYDQRVLSLDDRILRWGATKDPAGTIRDIDDNLYHIIKLCNTEWLVENLSVSKFNDGTPLTYQEASVGWSIYENQYCWWDNDPSNKSIYGALYSPKVVTGEKNIAPLGWRVANASDYESLFACVDMVLIAGGGTNQTWYASDTLKDTDGDNWHGTVSGATNESGWTGRGGLARDSDGSFTQPASGSSYGMWRTGDLWRTQINGLNSSATLIKDSAISTVLYGASIKCCRDVSTEQDPSIGIDPSTLTDDSGNVYEVKKIGNAVWMMENLKTTKFSDGTDIPYSTSEGYCWPDNSIGNASPYGALYTERIMDPSTNGGKSIAPEGWRIPSINDWKELFAEYGMYPDQFAPAYWGPAEVLKESGTDHWISPNDYATNTSGFTIVGAGRGSSPNYFKALSSHWTFTKTGAPNKYAFWYTDNTSNSMLLSSWSVDTIAQSVRCVWNGGS